MGNQMFQCAFGRFLADTTQGELVIDKSPLWLDFLFCLLHGSFKFRRHYGLSAFSGPSKERQLSLLGQCGSLLLWVILRAFPSSMQRLVLNWTGITWSNVLGGIPTATHMPRNYPTRRANSTLLASGVPLDIPLLPSRDRLREYFAFPPISNKELHKLATNIGEGRNWCSVHIRRSDYLSFGGELDTSYHRSAIEYVKSHAAVDHWLFFSDDIDWCRKTFSDILNALFFEGDYKNPIEDLRFMTLCRSHIIANSTLSWWGAYLAKEDDVTVYPASWYSAEESRTRFPTSWKSI